MAVKWTNQTSRIIFPPKTQSHVLLHLRFPLECSWKKSLDLLDLLDFFEFFEFFWIFRVLSIFFRFFENFPDFFRIFLIFQFFRFVLDFFGFFGAKFIQLQIRHHLHFERLLAPSFLCKSTDSDDNVWRMIPHQISWVVVKQRPE